MADTENATATDAELILRLYELRRETEMRKARNWLMKDFWPATFEEFQCIVYNPDSPENHYFRQVCGYWEMACALVVRGALHPGLFYDTSGEAWFIYAKIKPFIQDMRTGFNSPEFLSRMERVLEGTPEGRDRLARIEQNISRWIEMRSAGERKSA